MKVFNIQNYQTAPNFQGQKEKLVDLILNTENPKKIKILADDVQRICESMGFMRNKKRGSHMSFKISETENIFFVKPHNNKNELSHSDKVKFKEFLHKYYKKPDSQPISEEKHLDLSV